MDLCYSRIKTMPRQSWL